LKILSLFHFKKFTVVVLIHFHESNIPQLWFQAGVLDFACHAQQAEFQVLYRGSLFEGLLLPPRSQIEFFVFHQFVLKVVF
jgi:hypothetical protein